MNNSEKITYFAETDYRGSKKKFGIKDADRIRHMYVIGKTGTGKSTLLENMAIQDIQNGNGIAFIDPHGKSAELLLDYVPKERMDDVLYFAPFDLEHPISFNVMEDVGADKRHLVANGLMSAFKKIWIDAWSARMEYILNNILLALLECPDSTLLGVNRMLADKDFRKKVVANITDISVKSFWQDEFARYGERYMQEAGAAIQNKVGQFISNPLVRNIIGQPHSSFDMREIQDKKKIMIVNLSKGRVGEANANLLGGMLITKIYLASMSRAEVSEIGMKKLPNFYLYVDEFQSFANESFADILSEARKYKLNLTIAHQYIEQMVDEVRAAVFGNIGTMIAFRVGAPDAEFLEKEFAPQFDIEDLVNLGFAQIYVKLTIDNFTSQPFSATTIPPFQKLPVSYKKEIIEKTRQRYSRPRAEVEKYIIDWHRNTLAEGENQKTTKALAPQKEIEYQNNKPQNRGNEFQQRPFQGFFRRFGSYQKPFRTSANETELRKAMSLEHLKQKTEGEKIIKKKKNISEENISELRKALGDILKEVKEEKKTDIDAKTINENRESAVGAEQKNNSSPAGREINMQTPAMNEQGQKLEKEERPKEVPEDVLRNILKTDEETQQV